MFSFKRADVDEIPKIQQIAAETWPSAYHPIIGEEQVTYMLDLIYSKEALSRQFSEGHYFYFIYRNDEIAGFASFGKISEAVWKLHKIYILPIMQGSGAGRHLLDFVIRKIVSLGASQLVLNVNQHNNARTFYERNGFTIIREEDINIGNGFFMNDYIMSLPLANDESSHFNQ